MTYRSEHKKIEVHHQRWDSRPEKKFEYRGFEVCIGESGPHFNYGGEVTREEFPHGYYQSMYTIVYKGKALFEVPLLFDFMHDLSWTDEARRQGRINAAVNAAKIHIDDYWSVMNEQNG